MTFESAVYYLLLQILLSHRYKENVIILYIYIYTVIEYCGDKTVRYVSNIILFSRCEDNFNQTTMKLKKKLSKEGSIAVPIKSLKHTKSSPFKNFKFKFKKKNRK